MANMDVKPMTITQYIKASEINGKIGEEIKTSDLCGFLERYKCKIYDFHKSLRSGPSLESYERCESDLMALINDFPKIRNFKDIDEGTETYTLNTFAFSSSTNISLHTKVNIINKLFKMREQIWAGRPTWEILMSMNE